MLPGERAALAAYHRDEALLQAARDKVTASSSTALAPADKAEKTKINEHELEAKLKRMVEQALKKAPGGVDG